MKYEKLPIKKRIFMAMLQSSLKHGLNYNQTKKMVCSTFKIPLGSYESYAIELDDNFEYYFNIYSKTK